MNEIFALGLEPIFLIKGGRVEHLRRRELEKFRDAWDTRSLPVIVAAVHLREATRELEELIGAVDVEEVLDRLFSAFCVGK